MENLNLTIVAKILAKPEKKDLVESQLFKLTRLTREEEGCVSYTLHQDNKNENLFFFYEEWETRELWKEHMKSAHIDEFKKATEGYLEEFTANEMKQIG